VKKNLFIYVVNYELRMLNVELSQQKLRFWIIEWRISNRCWIL